MLFVVLCAQLAQQLRVAKMQQQDAVPTTEEEKKKRYKQKKVCQKLCDFRGTYMCMWQGYICGWGGTFGGTCEGCECGINACLRIHMSDGWAVG